jgi:glucose-6-phosphate isomerase
VNDPIDPSTTTAWAALEDLADEFDPDLRAWLADEQRVTRWTHTAGDLFVDLSKSLADDAVLSTLLTLASQTGVAARREAMFAGEHINVTEDRAVLHTALRLPRSAALTVDGQDVVADVHEVLDRAYAFADAVAKHFVAVSTALDKVADFGIDPPTCSASGTGSAVATRWTPRSACR